MAPNDELEARARFLQEAANLLAVSSPKAAAFIGRAHHKFIEDAEIEIPSKEADAYRRSICNAFQALRHKARRKNQKSAPVLDAGPIPTSKNPAKEVDNAPKTLNASSKQRQKARKGGLQAMLDKKKSQHSASGGLDLMDFAM
ncbi:hypothetical protein COCC4DRAFT_187988 [Bipolaris maydis ATCC 48331]|uniref:Uncharacterized protein n=2 Tax=Cochliobolus heterostrophus TaxID=5016 RepID=M2UV11_COCH5|nr:uncharacterized protein COCC4DRAFT_187988 [Bipolaris maydis ATCC 48331]EMD84768.1 hypothetical protein COCHEDRAFT_1189245 [Bipolaris maydis C5]EMD91693.1 hypothetical protein COCHEDRAFT_1175912 [Bipolaris maydis C5]ENI08549.1 hypothetical protein COCC4DRAFT_187988 [Bipolaris maydis ATCC 48331]KAJ6209058.1 hypothetical protein PSV09DRAFT_1189245 [Bipolaris maydis]